jgi:hypothetical protein
VEIAENDRMYGVHLSRQPKRDVIHHAVLYQAVLLREIMDLNQRRGEQKNRLLGVHSDSVPCRLASKWCKEEHLSRPTSSSWPSRLCSIPGTVMFTVARVHFIGIAGLRTVERNSELQNLM